MGNEREFTERPNGVTRGELTAMAEVPRINGNARLPVPPQNNRGASGGSKLQSRKVKWPREPAVKATDQKSEEMKREKAQKITYPRNAVWGITVIHDSPLATFRPIPCILL